MKRFLHIPASGGGMDIQAGSLVMVSEQGYFGTSVVNTTPGITTDLEARAGSVVLAAVQQPNVEGLQSDVLASAASVVLIVLTPEPSAP